MERFPPVRDIQLERLLSEPGWLVDMKWDGSRDAISLPGKSRESFITGDFRTSG